MIEARNLGKSYARPILEQAQIVCQNGTISYLMAPNGAGKTTLFKCLLGLEDFDGQVNFSNPQGELEHRDVWVVHDVAPFYESWTVRDNAQFVLGPELFHRNERELSDILGLGSSELLGTKAKKLSFGQRKLVQLAIAFASGRTNLILDEISVGLDYGTAVKIQEHLIRAKESKAILCSGHDMNFYQSLADRILILDNAQVHDVTAQWIERERSVKEIYEHYYL